MRIDVNYVDNQLYMDDLKLKFGSDTHQIDANTLINNLLHFTNIVQEVNKELGTNRKIDIKINALQEGSFLVHIMLQSNLINQLGDIFTAENIKIAGSIVTVVGGIYKAAVFLRGKKPVVVESNDKTTTIKNESGNVTVIDNRVINIYNSNQVVRESISKEFETLNNDANISSFDILDKDDKPIVEITREDFFPISNLEDFEVQIEPHERVVKKTGILSITSLSFEGNNKWVFYFDGNRFNARINDDEFVKLVDSGEKFAKGDALEAEFEIKQEYYEPANAFVNKSYRVTKIIRHIPRPEQNIIDFNSPI